MKSTVLAIKIVRFLPGYIILPIPFIKNKQKALPQPARNGLRRKRVKAFGSYAEACRMGVEVISGNLRGKLEAQEKKPLARLWSW